VRQRSRVATRYARRSALWAVCASWLFISVSLRAETPAEHLMALVESQDLEQIGAYLAQPGVGINDRPNDYKTLLDFAAEKNRVNVTRYLIEHGADLNATPQNQEVARQPPPGVTALGRAAYFNSIEVMDLLLEHGAEVNSPPGRPSALIYGAKQGNLQAVEVLVAHGANINQEFGVHQTAISEAIQGGHVDVARFLASHGATFGPGAVYFAAIAGSPDLISLALESKAEGAMLNEALAAAAGNGRVDESTRQRMLALLLAHGADPDASQNGLPKGVMPRAFTADTAAYLLDHGANSRAKLTAYQLAAEFCGNGGTGTKDSLPLDRMLVGRGLDFRDPGTGRSTNPLTCAVRASRIDLMDFLLDHGANVGWPNFDGSVPIFFARTSDVVMDLLKHGADLDQTGEEVQKDGSLKPIARMTPVSFAIRSSQWDQVKLFVSMGADVRTEGGSLLADVAVRGPAEIVTTLLDHGADINAPDPLGETALMAAVRARRQDRVEMLLDRGANVNVHNRMGRTALHLAVEAEDANVVKLLLARGADRTASYLGGITAESEARTAELRQLLNGGVAAPITDGTSARDRTDCMAALTSKERDKRGDPASSSIKREPGEDWDYLDQVVGDPVGVSVGGRSYLFAASDGAGYLGRIDADGVERIVCEYGKGTGQGTLRPLTEYQRLQARSHRDFRSISLESLQLQGLRGAMAILGASRRPGDPVPLQFNSDQNLLGDAAGDHRDDILEYYLAQGVDPDLPWLEHPLVDGVHAAPWHSPPLYTAVGRGSDRAVQLLLSHGANPDAAEPPPQPGPYWVGKPALALAVLHRDAPIVEALLAHGANPEMPSGHGFPPGIGIYSGFAQVLGGEVDQWITAQMFGSQQPWPDLVANAAVLFRHGASPDPWLNTALFQLQLRARSNGVQLPEAVLRGIATAPVSAQVRDVADGIRATYPRVSELLSVALRFRDAPPCDDSTAPGDLQYCLPKSLRAANNDLDARYDELLTTAGADTETIRRDQRVWIVDRDKACGVKELKGVTQAGWLASVLSDPGKAQCVLRHTRDRVAALPTARAHNT
jgi:ankyrin repeat protein/uncharacterized protein YecT (DUF1311 family)